MDEREVRLGKNEILFREVNERVKELNRSFSLVLERMDFVCECGDSSCIQHVQMTLQEYETVRRDPRRFVIVHRHEDLSVECVVEQHERFSVVEKDSGGPAKLATENDPRSSD